MSKLFWYLLLVLAPIPAGVFGYGAWEQHRRLSTFKPVKVTVVSSRVEERQRSGRRGRRRTIYQPLVEYRYEVGGRTYTSSRIKPWSMGTSDSWGRGRSQQIVAHFSRGSSHEGYHDPQSPGDAFLLREYSFEPYGIALGATAIAGIVLLASSRLMTLKHAAPVPGAGGWVELKPARSLGGKLGVWLVTSGLWHAVGVSFAAHWFVAVEAPAEPWTVAAFTAYEALGLVPLGAAAYFWLLGRRLFEAVVSASDERPRLGGELRVRVEQQFRDTVEVEAMRVGLVCEETQVEMRGAKRITSKRIVHEEWQTLLEGRMVDSGDTLSGETRFRLHAGEPSSPPGSKGYPRHAWRVAVNTKSPGSPDYKADFPITVAPAA